MFLDFHNIVVLIVTIIITVLLLFIGFRKKKSFLPAIALLFYTALLLVHTIALNLEINLIVDTLGMIASITVYLIVDEIEIRRKKINEVFENRYKDGGKP